MTDRLGNPHISALLALMVLAREVPNPELDDIAGFRIIKDVHKRLVDEGLVTFRKVNRSYAHELTEKGYSRCAEELTAERPHRPGPLGSALYLVLGGIDDYLRRENLRLADMFKAELTPDGIESYIRTAYGKLARRPGDWVRLVELRPLLNGASPHDVDGVLKELSRTKQVHLVPDSNRKMLTGEDHAAAVKIGGEDNHLIAIEES